MLSCGASMSTIADSSCVMGNGCTAVEVVAAAIAAWREPLVPAPAHVARLPFALKAEAHKRPYGLSAKTENCN